MSCLSNDQFEFTAFFMVCNLLFGPGFILGACTEYSIFQYLFSCYYPRARTVYSRMFCQVDCFMVAMTVNISV